MAFELNISLVEPAGLEQDGAGFGRVKGRERQLAARSVVPGGWPGKARD